MDNGFNENFLFDLNNNINQFEECEIVCPKEYDYSNEDYSLGVHSLYEEILRKLNNNDKTFDDVEFVSCNGKNMDIDTFVNIAKNTFYDTSGDSIENVPANDVYIVGCDWWIEPTAYCESEDDIMIVWDFKKKPIKPKKNIKIVKDKNPLLFSMIFGKI